MASLSVILCASPCLTRVQNMKGKWVVSSPCKKILIICSGLYALSTSSQAKIIHLYNFTAGIFRLESSSPWQT